MMSNRIGIAFISYTRSADRWTGSGIPFSTAQALGSHCGSVVEIGPFPIPPSPVWKRPLWRAETLITGKTFRWKSSMACARQWARQVNLALEKVDCDIIFSALSGWTVAALETDTPLVLHTDATVVSMTKMGVYSNGGTAPVPFSWLNMPPRSLRQARDLERRLMRRATGIVVSSDWARQSVVGDYGVEPSRVLMSPNGANLIGTEIPSRADILPRSIGRPVHFLFVGRPWQPKGGPLAVAVLDDLQRRGIDLRFTVVGCQPPQRDLREYMTVRGYLDKNDPKDSQLLARIYRESDVFLLPTRGEAFGIVYAEASAYGLPSIASDVGGVRSAVVDGETGLVVPPDASPSVHADAILGLLGDPVRYSRTAEKAREHFDKALNWNVWGRAVSRWLPTVLPPALQSRIGPLS